MYGQLCVYRQADRQTDRVVPVWPQALLAEV